MPKKQQKAPISQSYKSEIIHIKPSEVSFREQYARTHSDKQIQQIAHSIESFGFTNPILVDEDYKVLAGVGRFKAAQHLKLKSIPIVVLKHFTESQRRAYILADNKLAEKAGWDEEILKIELETIIELNTEFDLSLTGFDTPEIDFIIHHQVEGVSEIEHMPEPFQCEKRVKSGDLWQLGDHLLLCGDSLKEESYKALFKKDEKARMCFIDPPYNVPIAGHVCNKGKVKHDEFAMASGEMSTQEFLSFLNTSLGLSAQYSHDGSLHYICMDWRHIYDLISATHNIYDELKNICVWNKQTAGMGSLYRSQHEFVCVFKKGKRPHTNNVELGKHGRYRSNIWDYPGVHAASHKSGDLKLHPTVKPTLMIADAILDCTSPRDVVLDCFSGSGSTLLAAQRTRRVARVVEYEEKYCDVTLHRFEKETSIQPHLIRNILS